MERSKNLHNFNLPPGLTWGRQHLLRCMKVDPVPAMHAIDDDKSLDSAGQPISTDDRRKKSGFELNSSSSSAPIKASSCPKEGEESSPPLKYKSMKKLASKPSPPAFRSEADDADGQRSEIKPTRPRRNLDKKEERPKFSIALSRKEIEEDFIAMTGKKPPKKPNKPPRSVLLKLDALSPGLWLSEVHQDRYKVNENGKI